MCVCLCQQSEEIALSLHTAFLNLTSAWRCVRTVCPVTAQENMKTPKAVHQKTFLSHLGGSSECQNQKSFLFRRPVCELLRRQEGLMKASGLKSFIIRRRQVMSRKMKMRTRCFNSSQCAVTESDLPTQITTKMSDDLCGICSVHKADQSRIVSSQRM